MLEDFRLVHRFRVPFADIDMLRHVNHAAYIVWAETIRSAYVAEVLEEDIFGRRGIIMVKLEFTYERPIEYRAQVAIGCRVSRIGGKSLDFSYDIWDETLDARAARGTSVLVAYDYATNTSQRVPDEWRQRIAAFERPEA